MPIFTRRRLQKMMDDLRPLLDTTKVTDILARLSKARPEQALGAEMELGLLWGIRQVADLKVEPALPNSSKRPEALSADLFGKPSYIEITTLSDGKLSGEEDMHRAAHKIVAFANKIETAAGKHLYFNFTQINLREAHGYTRKHGITPNFELDEHLKDQIARWINTSSKSDRKPLALQNEHIDVVIEFKIHPQKPGFNFFSSLPPLAYDIEKNPLYAALKEKAHQVSGVPDDALKVIFVADGGSRLLRLINDTDHQRLYKSGAQIIWHFLNKSSVHGVCVFSPFRQQFFPDRSRSLSWQVSLFCQNNVTLPEEKLQKLAETLPAPKFEGYQARSLHKQGLFDPGAQGWYLGTQIAYGRNHHTMKMSALLLHEYLAGKISREQFERNAFGEGNDFKRWLESGYALCNARFESAGLDEDDDYVIFEFSPDPALSSLK